MSRFAWLQFRTQAVVAAAGLAVVAVVLATTGPHLVHLYDTTIGQCTRYGDCTTASSTFLQNDRALQVLLDALVVVVPAIVGIFWGAPLVSHELETGTFRLAWTQSISRSRWFVVKVGVVGLASMAAAGLVSLAVTWWSSPVDRANMSLYTSFDQRGIVPIGYAAFAFAFGALAGVLIRRTLPAMAATLVGFVTTRLLFNHFVLPKLIAPLHGTYPLGPATVGGFGSLNGGPPILIPADPNLPNAWVYSTQFVDQAGRPLSSHVLASTCPLLLRGFGAGGGGSPGAGGHSSALPAPAAVRGALQSCITKLGATYHEVVAYQPAGRYWPFQWYEMAIYLVLALVLAGAGLWWVRRRLS